MVEEAYLSVQQLQGFYGHAQRPKISTQSVGGGCPKAFTDMLQGPQILPWTNFRAEGREEKLVSLPGS